MQAQDILDFWFDPDHRSLWFAKSDEFDAKIRERFQAIHHQAIQAELWSWRKTAEGRLAEIIVLDQFSRNLCREQACAFAQDGMALALAQEAIGQPYFDTLPAQWRKFIIMPFMHSESAMIHERYLPLFKQLNDATTLEFEERHKEIIDKFGRYPHRNDTLDRETTDEEEAFLKQPNSSF